MADAAVLAPARGEFSGRSPAPSRRELAACAAGLAALALVMCLSHIRHGGFYFDDWWVLSLVRSPAHGISQAVGDLWPYYGQRPGQVAYYAVVEPLLGYRSHLQLALAATMLIGEGTLLFALMRRLALPLAHAAGIAVLVVAFPFDDSVWLWPIMSVSTLAVIASLGGVLLALRALGASGGRAIALHTASLGLYVAGIFTYELFAVTGCLVGALYVRQAGWRRARLRWALDVATIVAAVAVCRLALPGDIATPHAAQSPLGALGHAGEIMAAGAKLAGAAAIPFSLPSAWIATALLVLVHGLAVATRRRGTIAGAEALRRWQRLAAAGAALAISAWAVYIPASGHYEPTAIATVNRINALAGVGVVVLVYASGGTLAALAQSWAGGARAVSLRPQVAVTVVAAVAGAALGAGYLARTIADTRTWDGAAHEQRRILARLHAALPRPPAAATVYAVDDLSQVESVPVLSTTLDLTGALRLSYSSAALRGVPVRTWTRFSCDSRRLRPLGHAYTGADGSAYGNAFVVYVASGRAVRVTNARECAALADG